MTESEWLGCADPMPMLLHLHGGRASQRKLRLFACGCCWRVLGYTPQFVRETLSRAIQLSEHFADRLASDQQREEQRRTVDSVATDQPEGMNVIVAVSCALDRYGMVAAQNAAGFAGFGHTNEEPAAHPHWNDVFLRRRRAEELSEQAKLLRCVLGNPFSPVTINPAWLTPTVVGLAQVAYDNRIMPAGTLDAARLAILADALEEAGCDNADLLNHLRQPGDHVRGCWPVDAVLGKS